MNSDVRVGQEYTLEIQSFGKNGDGMARMNGMVIFCKNTQPGQVVTMRITHVGDTYAKAEKV